MDVTRRGLKAALAGAGTFLVLSVLPIWVVWLEYPQKFESLGVRGTFWGAALWFPLNVYLRSSDPNGLIDAWRMHQPNLVTLVVVQGIANLTGFAVWWRQGKPLEARGSVVVSAAPDPACVRLLGSD